MVGGRGSRSRRIVSAVRALHSMSGALLSLVLIVIGLTGALLVFKDDYVQLTTPQARQTADLSPSALAAIAEAAAAEFGADHVRAVVFAAPHFGLHKVYLTERRAAYLDGDGTVVASWGPNERFEDWVFDLHHRLLAGSVGQVIAGVAGLAASALAFTGLIAFYPARKAWRRGLIPRSLDRSELQTAHRNLGVVSAPLILILVLTGGALAFPQTVRALFDQISPRGAEGVAQADSAHMIPADAPMTWRDAIVAAKARFPDAAPRVLIWGDENRPPSLRLKQPGEWHPNGRTLITFHAGLHGVASDQNAHESPLGRRAWNAVYPIHAAHAGGRVYDVIVAAGGLALTALGAMGLYSFTTRRSSARK